MKDAHTIIHKSVQLIHSFLESSYYKFPVRSLYGERYRVVIIYSQVREVIRNKIDKK